MFKRRVILHLIALALVLASVRAIDLSVRAHRHKELSKRLTIALDGYEWAPIRTLILQGADPRTRGLSGTTALSWALNQNDAGVTRRLLTAGSGDPLAAVREAPPVPTQDVDPAYLLGEMEVTLEQVVRQPAPPLLNAWLGLATTRLRMGKYSEAATAFRKALALDARNQFALQGVQDAERAAVAAAAIRASLPAGTSLLHAFPTAPNRWVAVWASVAKNGGPGRYGAVKARVFRISGTRAWAIGKAVPILDPRWPDDAATRLGVNFHDVTGDQLPELVVELIGEGASWTPTSLQVFSHRDGNLGRILQVTSSSPLWMKDLNRDGTYEVGNSREIGTELSHAQQPRWEDIYAFDGRRYVLANRKFPGEFHEWVEVLSEVHAECPTDGQILDYLGRTHEILGKPALAVKAYQQANDAYAALIVEESDPKSTYRKELMRWRRGVQKRLRALAPESHSGR